ncbi:flavodoxin family protein [Tessaracoccus sp. Z1128]
MKAVVVYESLWGNTASVARAVAEGLGEGAQALPAAEVGPEVVTDADLIVAGGPVFAFHLSSERTRGDISTSTPAADPAPDLSGMSIRAWMDALPTGSARFAAFDTEVRGPFGKGAPTIAKELAAKGYRSVAKPEGFIVQGKYGPLKDGELERARRWGQSLRDVIPG